MIERYTRPAMARIWSDSARLRIMLDIESVYLRTLAKAKGIPAAELKAFDRIAGERSALAGRAKEREAKSGHEVIGILAAVSDRLATEAPRAHRYLHYGLTSSDVLDTTLAIQLRDSADLLIAGWQDVSARLKALARKHEKTWMAGRTHGVHAEPLTFGVKLAGWHAEALRNLERLKRAREQIAYGKLSGAVGSFAHVGPDHEAAVCERLGLKAEPVATQIVPRDRHADFFHALVLSAAAIERFATEIRHLQRTEVLEAEEPFTEGQKGSSAMPHKRNPVLCENLCGLSRLIRSYEGAIVENIVTWHERDISHSSVERIALPDAAIALDFMLARFETVVSGLNVRSDRMKANLDASLGLVYSQKVLLKLIDAGMGRLPAYDVVQRAAMETWSSRRPFLQVLSSDPAVVKRLSKAELESCFDGSSYGTFLRDLLKRGGVY